MSLYLCAAVYRLDLKHVVAVGHSSGGQLAVWLGARGKLPKNTLLYTNSPLPLNGVVSIDGPPDLEADRAIEQSVCGGPVVTDFLGGTPTEYPSRYREGSASGLLPIGTKQEIFVATTFGEKWITLFKQYVAAAAKAGDSVRLLTMDGAGHFDGINPKAPASQAVMASIESLVTVH
jgi:acetyl esterase/lipase